MTCLQVLLQSLEGSETALAKTTHSSCSDYMVLRMKLQLLDGFEGQAALVATVLVDVAIGYWQLGPFSMNFIEMRLKGR